MPGDNQDKQESFWSKYKIRIIFILFTFFLPVYIFWFIPYLIYNTTCFDYVKDCTGWTGDTIGGLTSPIIGLFSAFLVYIAFREQKKANDIQQKALKSQKEESEHDREYEYLLKRINDIKSQIQEFEFIYTMNGVRTSYKNIDGIYEIIERSNTKNTFNYIDFFNSDGDFNYYRYGLMLAYLIDSMYNTIQISRNSKVELMQKAKIENELYRLFKIIIDPGFYRLLTFKRTSLIPETRLLNNILDTYQKLDDFFKENNYKY